MNNNSGKFPNCTGYISEPERIALQRCVLDTAHIVGDSVEIGSLNGLSAMLILTVLESHKRFFCIEKGDVTTLRNNVRELSTESGFKKVEIINEDFANVRLKEEQQFSFVFIDHDHTFENNMAAFEQFWPHVAPGGVIAFHDYGNPQYPEGTKAIDAIRERIGSRTSYYKSAGSLIAFEKHD